MITEASSKKEPIVLEFSPREQLYFQVTNVVDDDLVLNAFRKIDRADFMPESLRESAYQDRAFDVGPGASISQPSLVGIMIEHLGLKGGEKVFELGVGTGLEARWLELIVGEKGEVISAEINEGLCKIAEENLQKAESKRVKIVNQDGARGLPGYGPYDSMIISASFRFIPNELVTQLKEGGTIVAPVGKDPQVLDLVVGKKVNGKLETKVVDKVWFHKVISDVDGAWTEESLKEAIKAKYIFCTQTISFMSPKQRLELWEDIVSHDPNLKEEPLNINTLIDFYYHNIQGDEVFYNLVGKWNNDSPNSDSTPDADVLK